MLIVVWYENVEGNPMNIVMNDVKLNIKGFVNIITFCSSLFLFFYNIKYSFSLNFPVL